MLHVPLDVFVVSKLGTPWNKELAMGAVAEGGVQVLDLSMVKALCVSEKDISERSDGRAERTPMSPIVVSRRPSTARASREGRNSRG